MEKQQIKSVLKLLPERTKQTLDFKQKQGGFLLNSASQICTELGEVNKIAISFLGRLGL